MHLGPSSLEQGRPNSQFGLPLLLLLQQYYLVRVVCQLADARFDERLDLSNVLRRNRADARIDMKPWD